MPSTKILLRYCFLLFAGYGLLLWLGWLPPLAKTFASAFHGVTLPVVEKTFPALTFFSKPPEGDQLYNYKIRFIATSELEKQKALAIQQGKTNLGLAGGTVLELKYHQVFFNPWFFLLCLILVTPLPWKKRLVSMLVGTFMFWLFAVIKLHLIIQKQSIFQASGFFNNLMDVMVSPGFVGFLVIVIWLLVTFRKNNWQQLLKQSEE